MMEKIRLGDLVEFQRGYDLPKNEFKNGTIPVISSNGILGYHNEVKVKEIGITIGRSGTVGFPYLIKQDFFPHNTTLFIKNFNGNNVVYIYYLLKSLNLNEYKSGSGVPTINRNHLHPLKVTATKNKETQQKIAKILSDIDDKIEVLHQINDNLAELAKTIYDYWFVQFDFPDENGKPYKSSGGKMVYNEVLKREIPEGWEVKSLGEIETNIITGKTPPTKDENNFNGNILFITIDDIRQNLFIYNSERTLSEKGANTQRAKFLKKGDICVSCIGTVGVIGIVGKIAQTNQQINSISNPQNFNKYFLLNYLDRYFKDNFTAKKGAVLDNMNKAEFESIIIINPIQNIKEIYYGKVKFLYEKIDTNIQQIQHLQSLRDWLLPMLMNGQISVE